ELDKAIGWNAECPDVGKPRLRYAGGRDRDQPRLAIDRAETLRDPVVPCHGLKNQAALREPHDVEARRPARQIERDIARGMTAIGERHADFTKRSKCLRSELCDGD